MSEEEEIAEINNCLKWVWRIATLTVVTSLIGMNLIIIIATIESKFSTISPKIEPKAENAKPVQGVSRLDQR